MIIVTSYYAKFKELKADGYFVVGISRTAPLNAFDILYPQLAPSAELLWWAKQFGDHKHLPKENWPEYIKRYVQETLAKISAQDVIDSLSAHGDKIALVCYEHPKHFCHRRLVANWFQKKLNIYIPEYGTTKYQTKSVDSQSRENTKENC